MTADEVKPAEVSEEQVRPVLQVQDLHTEFMTPQGATTVVDHISFDVHESEIVSLVGESGSGKSVTAMSVLQLVSGQGRISGGAVVFEGTDLRTASRSNLQRVRGGRIGTVFQEPMHSMNPVFTIGHQLAETLRAHTNLSRGQAHRLSVDWLGRVGLPQPAQVAKSHPHELSGGMLQRAMIAMALCCEPSLLIADEPTTALDVTVQAQILALLLELRDELSTAVLFITHDLGVVAQIADQVLVMYDGRIVERGPVLPIFDHPRHPYTAALLATKPVLGQRAARLPVISDDVRTYASDPGNVLLDPTTEPFSE